MNVVIYTKTNCPNCVTAKRLLDSKGIGYENRWIGLPVWLDQLDLTYPDVKQMPLIIINGQRVGGLAGLRVALKELGL
jgi:glutaredoxin 3